MEVVSPLQLYLDVTGSPSYIYSAWGTGTAYAKGTTIRYQIGGVWRDFRAGVSHTSSSTNAPDKYASAVVGWWIFKTTTSYWIDLGASTASGGYTYTTNTALSLYPAWTSGATVVLGQRVYDQANNHDYESATALSYALNTARPSETIISLNESIAAYWVDLGASNAWAAIDLLGNTYIQGFDTNGALCDPAFTVTCACVTDVDRVAFAGLVNVKTISVTVTDDGVARDAIVTSLTPSGTAYGATYRTANIPITTVAAGSAMKVAVVLTRNDTSRAAQCGIMVAGRAHTLSGTEWGVETSILSFSRKERDEVFGTMTFVKRGSSRQIRATCFVDPLIITGDVVQELLTQWDGMPAYWDFNGDGTTYDRLRVFGFYTNMGMVIQFSTAETLSLTVEGLVE